MKVLFVITNINNNTYSDAYSIALASLASISANKGVEYDYSVINKHDNYNDFFNTVKCMRPNVVAYTSVSSQFIFIKELSMKIRSLYGNEVIQICGGVHTTIFPESILEAKGLDGVFVGESDYAFSDFLDRVSNGAGFKDVKNFAYNDKGNMVKNNLYPLITNLDALPFPEREKYGYGRFIKQEGFARFIFTRGCPFNCAYCSNHAIAGAYGLKHNMPRYKTPVRCIEEIKEVVNKYFAKKVFVTDDTFGMNKKWMGEFCNLYAKEVKLPFMCQVRVNLVDEEFMENLRIAGCVYVGCGIESGNEYMRNHVMKRNISQEQIIKAFKMFKKHKLATTAINIIGLPHETVSNIWDTIKLNRRINPAGSAINIFYPYQGTELGDYCLKEGFIKKEDYDHFCDERKESILNFSTDFKKKLYYFYKNWELLVFLYRPYKFFRLFRIVRFIKNRCPLLWNIYIKMRRKCNVQPKK